jgi:hypothetical protein
MALSASNVIRTDDPPGGDSFLTFDTPVGDKAQGMALVDSNGVPIGFAGSPIVTTGTITGTVATTVSGTVTTVVSGQVSVTTTLASVTFFHSGGSNVASYVIHTGSGTLKELRVVLASAVASIRYLMLFRGVTTLPANGTVPSWVIMIPPLGEASESFPIGLAYTGGLVAGVSTSHLTLTPPGSPECVIFGQRT